MLVFSEELPHWFFFFQLYSTTINGLIWRQQIILSAVHFFPHHLTLFLTYYSVSSPLRKLRLSTYHPNAGRECAGHSKSFFGEQGGVSGDAFGYCTRGTVSPEQSLLHWEGSRASPAPISHALSEMQLVGREVGCPEPFLLPGREGRGSLSSFLLSASTAEDAQQPSVFLLTHKRFVFIGKLLIERSLCM